MSEAEAITSLQERLAIHRKVLAYSLQQLAQVTSAFAPPELLIRIDETRAAIKKIKANLNQLGAPAENLPDDVSEQDEEERRSSSNNDTPEGTPSGNPPDDTPQPDKVSGSVSPGGVAFEAVPVIPAAFRQSILHNVRRRWLPHRAETSRFLTPSEAPHTPIPPIPMVMQDAPDAVCSPMGHIPAPPHLLNQYAVDDIAHCFEKSDRQLLLLGQAGDGKSTLMTKLLEVLCTTAETDPDAPIPLMLPLGTWKRTRSIDQWLCEALQKFYNVPPRLARMWLRPRVVTAIPAFILLLDGLDEVGTSVLAAYIRAINAYCEYHATIQIAISCRTSPYLALPYTQRLCLHGALTIVPLTPAVVKAYLKTAGPSLNHVRRALDDDPDLRALATTPFMIDIIARAYVVLKPRRAAALSSAMSQDARRHQLFATYVEAAQTERGTRHLRYSPERTQQWLCWLARSQQRHHEPVLLLDYLQPKWLSSPMQVVHQVLVILAITASAALIGTLAGTEGSIRLGIIAGVAACLGQAFGQIDGGMRWRERLLLGGICAVQIGVYTALSTATTVPMAVLLGSAYGVACGIGTVVLAPLGERLAQRISQWLHRDAGLGLQMSVQIGLGVGLASLLLRGVVIGVMDGWGIHLLQSLLPALRSGVIFGATTGLLAVLFRAIEPVEAIAWRRIPWRAVGAMMVIISAVYGLIAVLHAALHLPYLESQDTMRTVLAEGLRLGILFGIITGLTTERIATRMHPNEGIHRSLRYSLWGAIAGLGAVLVLAATPGVGIAAGSMLLMGLVFRLGYVACLQHLILRLLLAVEGVAPLNYVRFLEQAVSRVLLRKVGGSYEFIHPLLQAYFASLFAAGPASSAETRDPQHTPDAASGQERHVEA